ncbi:hypothetical protein TEA_000407 [Camellia sinensis var. sinensis]|uniref:Acyl-[acyl-carrier-protein] hydrolase n=1 Tax=Camellia sinensis var. sinensis TaxID=542762 RepID=A0A4S4E739_CAMSN|nr:hypothetical protein TEA_000407 [Camellia sinensis var. sinensis]
MKHGYSKNSAIRVPGAGTRTGTAVRVPGTAKEGPVCLVHSDTASVRRWGDVVQVNSWVAASGKNGMRRDWIVHDCKTGDILTRASSVWVMMNKETRRLSKIPDEVRVEIGPYFVDSPPVLDEDSRKLPKLNESTADYIRTGLTPKRSDLDVNLHVNNVKYVGWIVEVNLFSFF